MGKYRMTDDRYGTIMACPSTKAGNFINKGPEGIIGTLAIASTFILPASIGLAVEVSLIFILGIIAVLVACGMLIFWMLNSYKMTARTYVDRVLPVELAYDRLSSERRKNYKHLVQTAYKNGVADKSNADIVELFNHYAEIDDATSSKFVEDELRLARQIKKDLKEVGLHLES